MMDQSQDGGRSDLSSLEGFVLAGGASSRMRSDKAKLVLNERTFVERTAAVATVVSVVGSPEKTGQAKLRAVGDVFENWGALGGLHAALSACGATWAAVVACDLPFVSGDLFIRLAAARNGFDAVAPIQSDGRPQPLCAIYRIDPCLKKAELLIKSGERRPVTLLQSVRTHWLSFAELEDLNGADSFFDNVNTPDDYESARRKGAQVKRRME
jgi:molybdopterin-guanine dinucleotide biosynthesis protein A